MMPDFYPQQSWFEAKLGASNWKIQVYISPPTTLKQMIKMSDLKSVNHLNKFKRNRHIYIK